MSVKSALDYYNTSDIQVGDIVILDDSRPLDCEGGRVAEPYTRLRVRDLQVESSGISVKLETERESILLTQNVYLHNMLNYHSLQKADSWFATTEKAHQLAQKESKVFSRLNPRILYVIFFLLWLPILFAAICWPEISNLPGTPSNVGVVLLTVAAVVGALFYHANIVVNKVNEMDKALEQATELEEQLRLYRQANPDYSGSTATSGSE